jgi:hypothetical protein
MSKPPIAGKQAPTLTEWRVGMPEPEPHCLAVEEEGMAWRLRYFGTEGQVMQWKDLFPTMEAALDKARTTAEEYVAKGYPAPAIWVVRMVRH